MEKVILKGNESKKELQGLMDKNSIKYSKVDSKIKLLDRIYEYNSSLGIDIVLKNQEKVVPIETEDLQRKYNVDEICSLCKLNNRKKFFLNLKYKDISQTKIEWGQIFKREKLV